jgi:DNA-binding LytR/AlgR family response regulator
MQYLSQLTRLAPQSTSYKDKLLIPIHDKLLPIEVKDIAFFYTTDKNTSVYMKDGDCYAYPKSLEQIIATLNPSGFTRANKQFIISRSSVKNITIWFDSRLLVTLDIETPERIYISKNKASEFKAWMVNEN